jgi:hypothetical protein
MRRYLVPYGLLLMVLLAAGLWRLRQVGDNAEPARQPVGASEPEEAREVVELSEEANAAFIEMLRPAFERAIGSAISKAIVEREAEFEIKDDVEKTVWSGFGSFNMGEGDRLLAICFVRQGPLTSPARQYEKRGDEGRAMRYARVTAPASRPLAFALARSANGTCRLCAEAAYDSKAKKWAPGTDVLKGEDDTVREAVAQAVRGIDPGMVAVIAGLSAEPDESSGAEELAKAIQRDFQDKRLRREPWEAVYHGGIPAINQTVNLLFLSGTRGYACLRTRISGVGTVRRKGDRFTLRSRDGDWGPNHSTDTKEFVLVPWSDRLYLIETNRVIEFCNAVNAGDEPRKEDHAPYLLREGDWKKEAKGRPSVPAPWRDTYLPAKPVDCVVRGVEGYREDVPVPHYPYTSDGTLHGIRATVSAGKGHGLHPGMTLFAQDPAVMGTFYVLSCKEGSSEVLLTRYLDSEEAMLRLVKPGLRCSTRKKR